jgi:hypothetical protein
MEISLAPIAFASFVFTFLTALDSLLPMIKCNYSPEVMNSHFDLSLPLLFSHFNCLIVMVKEEQHSSLFMFLSTSRRRTVDC